MSYTLFEKKEKRGRTDLENKRERKKRAEK